MSATPVQADARCLPLADESVDLIITSPPYFALRSYRDGGDHYDGQVGSEPTPQAFLEALWEVSKEAWRCLKPTGSYFVNLGDKRAGSWGNYGARNGGQRAVNVEAFARPGAPPSTMKPPSADPATCFGRPKSKMLLPHRFAIGCEDGMADPEGIGWIVRSDMVWSKPNGLPESVVDRVRDSHEYWFHLVKQGRYFSAVDEIREAYDAGYLTSLGRARDYTVESRSENGMGTIGQGPLRSERPAEWQGNPLGKLPGSVWTIASEPLTIPEAVKAHYDLPDHFAAFPQEWPRRLILGWSPSGVCVACGEGRRPVVAKEYVPTQGTTTRKRGFATNVGLSAGPLGASTGLIVGNTEATITGYACACPDASAPTKPSVVVDIFGGTGTVAGVARQLGRTGISFDLSHDYSRLAQWFLDNGRRFAKTSSRTDKERQGVLL